jgi:hypothetical protein
VALEQRPGGHPPSPSYGGGTRPPLQEVDWEVLPPEEKRKRQGLEPLFKWLALIMDEFVRVPGTKFRFGLDPLIGLIPGIGDTGSALVSAFALIQALRVGVPKILLARMSLNILINEVIGIVPIVGDAFSFWFKSNARNYEIIKDHISTLGTSRRSDWIFVVAVLVLLLVVICLGIAVSFFFLRQLAKLLASF